MIRPVIKAALAVTGAFLVGVVVLGSRDRPVVYDSHRSAAPTNVPTFPGAEGWGGMATSSCRELQPALRFVTNLNSSGDGSLRQALESGVADNRYTFVIFRTGGIITDSRITTTGSCLYLAGQSAPGGGILHTGGLRFDAGKLLVRYIRIRLDGLGFKSAVSTVHREGDDMSDSYFNHLSVSWSTDELLSAFRFDTTSSPMRRMTWSHNLTTEPIISHPTVYTIGGIHCPSQGGPTSYCPDSAPNAMRGGQLGVWHLDMHRNLMATIGHRLPNMATADARTVTDSGASVINNLAYDWGNRTVSAEGKPFTMDLINNWYKQGPKGIADGMTIQNMGAQNDHLHEFVEPHVHPPADSLPWSSYYIAGNVLDSTANFTIPTQRDFMRIAQHRDQPIPTKYIRAQPFASSPVFPITIITAREAYDSVLASVGADERVDCDGTWVAASDSIDLNAISNVINTTGPTTLPSVGGTLPTLAAGTACTDTDSDGMPDVWEDLYTNTDKTVFDPAGDVDGDGFWNLEEYLAKCGSGVSCSPDVFTNADASEGAPPSPPPPPTFGNGRFVYQDTFVLDTIVTGGGLDTIYFVRLDTVAFPLDGAIYAVTPKDIGVADEGDTILILVNDSVVGALAKQLDSVQVDSLAGVLGSEGEWDRCESRGICTDTLRNRAIP